MDHEGDVHCPVPEVFSSSTHNSCVPCAFHFLHERYAKVHTEEQSIRLVSARNSEWQPSFQGHLEASSGPSQEAKQPCDRAVAAYMDNLLLLVS